MRLSSLVLLILVACGSSPGSSSSSGSTGGGDCKSRFPISQTLSEGCCLDWGVDACGADLFCAALDGRTQPTCYPEGSRRDGTTCTADVQCTSAACNAGLGRCKSSPNSSCDAVVGCAPSADGRTNYCGLSGGSLSCQNQKLTGQSCSVDPECLSGTCNHPAGQCFTQESCHVDGDCPADSCSGGHCSLSGASCTTPASCPVNQCQSLGGSALCS